VQGKILLSHLSFPVCQELSRIQAGPVVVFAGKQSLEVEDNSIFSSGAIAENAWMYTSNRQQSSTQFIYRNTETI
jgi:hypothetical protein